MKTKIKTFIDKVPKNVILCIITGLLIISVMNMSILKIEKDSINKIETAVTSNMSSLKKSHLTTFIDLGYKLCKQTTDLLAKKLENAIIKDYDLDTLKNEFENSKLSSEFYNIIKDALNVTSDENELFSSEKITMVALKNGLIAEFSNTNKQLNSKTELLSWQEYINNSINPQLTSDALDIVLNNKNKIAFIQKDGKVIISKSDISKLIDLYMKEGKNVLKDYYFITASFITEDGDIFGNDDKTFLSSNENYKLIVLNSTSAFEVMELFETDIMNIDTNNSEVLTRVDGYTDLHYLSSVLSSIIMFISALFMVVIYNKKVN